MFCTLSFSTFLSFSIHSINGPTSTFLTFACFSFMHAHITHAPLADGFDSLSLSLSYLTCTPNDESEREHLYARHSCTIQWPIKPDDPQRDYTTLYTPRNIKTTPPLRLWNTHAIIHYSHATTNTHYNIPLRTYAVDDNGD